MKTRRAGRRPPGLTKNATLEGASLRLTWRARECGDEQVTRFASHESAFAAAGRCSRPAMSPNVRKFSSGADELVPELCMTHAA